jgi:hypothetical protein
MWPFAEQSQLRRTPVVLDAGVYGRPVTPAVNIVVVRGPCSLAVRRVASASTGIDHLLLISEPWRPLRARDVEDAVGMPIAVEVPFSPRVARLADAGLLTTRVATLDEFAGLTKWATDALADLGSRLHEAGDDLEEAVDIGGPEEALRSLGSDGGER